MIISSLDAPRLPIDILYNRGLEAGLAFITINAGKLVEVLPPHLICSCKFRW
jgi:hypothetical protein